MPLQELYQMQEAIRGESLDGWLFCNFHHRDKLSEAILKTNPDSTNSRLWIYAVPAEGEPLRVVHAIETDHLDMLPGQKISYVSREDLFSVLQLLANKRWGVHVSDTLTAISYLDAGTAAAFEAAGLRLVSAAGLVQRFKGLLDPLAIASHEKAASGLYDIVEIAWDTVRRAYAGKRPLREGDLRRLILDEMDRRGLVTDHPPIVAAGAHAGNPHYDFPDSGALLKEGDVIQFDLWAKEQAPGAIYGDISWVGVFAPSASARVEEAFSDLLDAREGAYHFIEAELEAGRRPSGAMVDQKTREILIDRGYGEALKHRTGHGIDTECHGSGVNIDSVEFPDSRLLLDGACFSLEPGIYFSDFGLRTEIDVYIQEGKPVISQGDRRQFSLLTCPDRS